MEFSSISPKQTEELAIEIAKKLRPGAVLALSGELGAGKTTFTGFLVKSLGITARTQSPTFVLMRRYLGTGINEINSVNHIDLYRIQSKAELQDLGITELMTDPNSITLIEWPEIAWDILPTTTVFINFEYESENARKITIQNLN